MLSFLFTISLLFISNVACIIVCCGVSYKLINEYEYEHDILWTHCVQQSVVCSAYHSTRSGDISRVIYSNSPEHHPTRCCDVLWFMTPLVNVTTYLLTYLLDICLARRCIRWLMNRKLKRYSTKISIWVQVFAKTRTTIMITQVKVLLHYKLFVCMFVCLSVCLSTRMYLQRY